MKGLSINRLHIFSLVMAMLVSACTGTGRQPDNVILDKALLDAYRQGQEALTKARSPLLLQDGGKVHNCKSYLLQASTHRTEESVNNQMIKSEYLVCDALGILNGIKKPGYQDAIHSNYGQQIAEKLDLRSFPSSLHRMGDAEKHTLNALFPGQVSTNGNLAILEMDDWTFRLEVVAKANLDNNNQPDWIVWLSDEAKAGNYRAYTTLVIYNPYGEKSIRAKIYP